MITGINKVFTFVDDQQVAKEFWTEAVGLPLVLDHIDECPTTPRWLEVMTPDQRTVIVLAKRPDGVPATTGQLSPVAFYATDVPTTRAELEARGVEFTEGIIEEYWGRSTTFKDPFGNLYNLSERTELVHPEW